MKLILTQDVVSLGGIGDIVNVKAGYARNYLLPRGLAVVASESRKAELAHNLRVLEKKKKDKLATAEALAKEIEAVSVTVAKQVGEDEKIFGSVTHAEIALLLEEKGITVDKRDIKVNEEIKKVGVYAGEVKVHPEVHAQFKIWVVAQ